MESLDADVFNDSGKILEGVSSHREVSRPVTVQSPDVEAANLIQLSLVKATLTWNNFYDILLTTTLSVYSFPFLMLSPVLTPPRDPNMSAR